MDYQKLKAAVRARGYVFFDRGQFNLNIVGVRTNDDAANTFNDWLYVAYRDQSNTEQCLAWRITTDPGLKYRFNPINPMGTGIIVPGQHRGVWALGKHKGAPALVQVKPLAVYRDENCDALLDYDESTIDRCMGGFNCHKSSKTGTSKQVDGWSAGCQVFANCHDHDMLLALARRSVALHGDGFTYTLLRECEL